MPIQVLSGHKYLFGNNLWSGDRSTRESPLKTENCSLKSARMPGLYRKNTGRNIGVSECPAGGKGSFVHSILVGWIPHRLRRGGLFEMVIGEDDNGRGSAENRERLVRWG